MINITSPGARRVVPQSTPCKHPVIVLQDVVFDDLQALVEFIYHGEVNVHQRNLSSFLKTAEVLRVSGLTQPTDSTANDVSTENTMRPYHFFPLFLSVNIRHCASASAL